MCSPHPFMSQTDYDRFVEGSCGNIHTGVLRSTTLALEVSINNGWKSTEHELAHLTLISLGISFCLKRCVADDDTSRLYISPVVVILILPLEDMADSVLVFSKKLDTAVVIESVRDSGTNESLTSGLMLYPLCDSI
ncbi:hypothetical protein Tco_0681945 [Tanacetum coccineum]|uniref:Uncharacterized protein n=1 Tax=Tanacetum coccineum TaxID=301880 RepID=A0ABQ4XRB0_9ASTR